MTSGPPRTPLRVTRVGSNVLVHPRGVPDASVLGLAQWCAAEAGSTIVALDIPSMTAPDVLEDVLEELASCSGTLCLVPTRVGIGSTVEYGSWLVERLHRPVVAHYGSVSTVAGGGLYVSSGENGSSGWWYLAPGASPTLRSRRFPRPSWECDSFAAWRGLGSDAILEPLPSGAWIRHAAGSPDSPAVMDFRVRLLRNLAPDPLLPKVVLGYPGSRMPSIAAVAEFWGSLPGFLQPAVRFAGFEWTDGTAAPFGQRLADALSAPVVMSNGVQLAGPSGTGVDDLRTVLHQGLMTWTPYVGDLGYLPTRSTGGVSADPVPIGHRVPIAGLPERELGVYEFSDDAVVEVTQSGLWMRPRDVPSYSSRVRTEQADPEHVKVVFDAGSPAHADRMRALASEMVEMLEPQVRSSVQIFAATAGETVPVRIDESAVEPWPDEYSTSDTIRLPADVVRAVRMFSPDAADLPASTDAVFPEPAESDGGSAAQYAMLGTAVTGPPAGSPADSAAYEPSWAADADTADTTESESRYGFWSPPPEPSAWPFLDDRPKTVSGAPADSWPDDADLHLRSTVSVPIPGDLPVPPPSASPNVRRGEQAAAAGTVEEAVVGTLRSTRMSSPPAESSVGPVGAAPTGAPIDSAPQTPWTPSLRPAETEEAEEPIEYGAFRLVSSSADFTAAVPQPPTAPVLGASATLTPASVRAVPSKESGPAEPAAAPSVADPVVPAAIEGATKRASGSGAGSTAPDQMPSSPEPQPATGATSSVPQQDRREVPRPPSPGSVVAAETAAPRSSASAVRRDAGGPAKPVVHVQPVPTAQCCVIPSESGIAKERDWVRRNLSRQYDAAASSVARIVSEHPGLRVGTGASDIDVLTDLVALRLYLSDSFPGLDAAVRSAKKGPHVPLARCVASGLRRLPSYRGPLRMSAALTEEQIRWYGDRSLVTEWSFLPALAAAGLAAPGNVDILIWSMSARRTHLLDPSTPDQAVFPPGTTFKVLSIEDRARPEIRMRELARSEVAPDGTVTSTDALDGIAVTALEDAGKRWLQGGPAEQWPAERSGRFSSPPGLLAQPVGTRGTAPTQKGGKA